MSSSAHLDFPYINTDYVGVYGLVLWYNPKALAYGNKASKSPFRNFRFVATEPGKKSYFLLVPNFQ